MPKDIVNRRPGWLSRISQHDCCRAWVGAHFGLCSLRGFGLGSLLCIPHQCTLLTHSLLHNSEVLCRWDITASHVLHIPQQGCHLGHIALLDWRLVVQNLHLRHTLDFLTINRTLPDRTTPTHVIQWGNHNTLLAGAILYQSNCQFYSTSLF
jgi:hypothetical protein